MSAQEPATWSPSWRRTAINKLRNPLRSHLGWDLIVVGGGITGAGIYREAVHRGLNVLLVEQQDFAWGTSSRSSKMVHGGLRYLGSGQFGLANDSVKERQNLMNELPGLVDLLPFLMGHYKGGFPGPWLFDKVLAIYDWMAGKRYRTFRSTGIKDFWVPGVNTKDLLGMTQFADAVVDDARLVLRVLHEGNNEGGIALNYVKATDTLRKDGKVVGVKLVDQLSNESFEVKAPVVINATGAWTDELRSTLGHHKVIRPLRGSHLVVPFWRLPVSFSVSFFHPKDKRPVFVFPWEGTTVVGTTDLDHKSDMREEASISSEELEYLLEAANHQFSDADLTAEDVRSTWSGVRPVVSKNQNAKVDQSKPSDEKREHAIWDDKGLISVAGGKLTTYRLIALDTLQKAFPYLKKNIQRSAFKETTSFSQGEPLKARSSRKTKRLKGRYGDNAQAILDIEKTVSLAGGNIGTTDTLWAELIWSCQNESIVHLDDLLLRRTRIGLLLEQGGKAYITAVRVICNQFLGWDDARWQAEYARYQFIVQHHYGLPNPVKSDASEVRERQKYAS